MAVVPIQVQLLRQVGLVEHDYVWSLLADEPVQVPLLLLRVDTPHIPHQDCQWNLGDTQLTTGNMSVLCLMHMCLLSRRGVQLSVIMSGVFVPPTPICGV